MPIVLPPEAVELRDTLRRFVDEVVEPRAKEIDETNDIPEEIFEKGRGLGLFGLSIPEEYGGLGESELISSVALETLSLGPGGVTFYLAPSAPAAAIRLAGTQQQKDRYLRSLASGEKFAAFCLSEAGAGSDAAGIKTRAVRRGDRWVINGTKLWASRAAKASIFLVSAVTDPEKRAKGGITVFVLDKRPGIAVGKPDWLLGSRGEGGAEVSLQDVEAAGDEVLGEVGWGFDALKFILGRARLWAAARSTGITARCLELSVKQAQERVQFGQPIGEFQAIKLKLADMASDLYMSRLLVYQAAGLFDQGQDPAQEAAYAKLFASQAACRAADTTVQVHGAMGLSQEYCVERLYRDARAYRILDGTDDIQRLMIASRFRHAGVGDAMAPGGLL
jgi:acyl-CoA dehydrogenase